MNAWKERHLKVKQGGLCPLCGEVIDLTKPREGVIDHDHDTGEIRGVLHRSCNSGEGKIANAAGSWIAKSMKYPAIRRVLARLLEYYALPGTGYMYPTHVSAEDKAEKRRVGRNLAARQARANKRARAAVKEMQ
ncbi:endonuclease VII [Ralstonia phage phiAp1]|uniref:DNA endonuclease n=1 Tax=Ralstonia phage phiAp1 TaxID=2783867 RepID=A0A1L7DS53_9CAUD|nr:endonuclease VII [Ralstonia phage phiAp1]APU03171.1 DNA endonuclease [Ralstonia phage phiAp1]